MRPFPARPAVVAIAIALGLVVALPALAAPGKDGAVFSVSTSADTVDAFPGDGFCADADGECSLRAAVMEANALAGAETIFIPGSGPGGPPSPSLYLSGSGEDASHLADCSLSGDTTGNLVGLDPRLPALPTLDPAQTWGYPPLPGSPAINAGNPADVGSSTTACEIIPLGRLGCIGASVLQASALRRDSSSAELALDAPSSNVLLSSRSQGSPMPMISFLPPNPARTTYVVGVGFAPSWSPPAG